MKRKITCIFLAVLMILSVAPITAYAGDIAIGVYDGTEGNKESEGLINLTDGDTSTKWCLTFKKGVNAIFFATEEVAIDSYTFTTANDTATHSGRNPKSWIFYGDVDGTWKELHTVTNDDKMEAKNYTSYTYYFSNTVKCKRFKISFRENQGDSLLQLSEITLNPHVDSYDVYVNDVKFSASNKTIDKNDSGSGVTSGSATYDPSSKTLTLNNLNVAAQGSENTVIYSEVPALTIKAVGTNNITIPTSKSTVLCAAIGLMSEAKITGGTINVTSTTNQKSTSYPHNRMAIWASDSLEITSTNLYMTDNSSGSYVNQSTLIDTDSDLTVTGGSLGGKNLGHGVYFNSGDFIANGVKFDVSLYNGSDNVCINLAAGSTNVLKGCYGTLSGQYGIYSLGTTQIIGGDSPKTNYMTFTSPSAAAIVADNSSITVSNSAYIAIKDSVTGVQPANGGSFELGDGSSLDITNTKTGVVVLNGTTVTVGSGELNATTNTARAIEVKSGGTLNLKDGSKVSLGTTSSSASFGIYSSGTVNISGGSLTTASALYAGIANAGTGAVTISGGTHNLSASTAGYVSLNKNNLYIKGNANVTTNAVLGLYPDYTKSTPGTVSITGGTLTMNYTKAGIYSENNVGVTKITGGTVNFNATTSSSATYGICKGSFEIGGNAAVNFSGNSTDIYSSVAGNKISGGNISCTASDRCLDIYANFEISGGNVVMTSSTAGSLNIAVCSGDLTISGGKVDITNTGSRNIAVLEGMTCHLTGGKLTTSSNSISLLSQSGTFDFAGTTAIIKGQYAWQTSGTGDFKINGGRVTFIGKIAATVSGMYSSISDDYGVFAGSDENSAVRVSNVTESTFTDNKYVHITDVTRQYQLFLDNVQSGEWTAAYREGDQFTYTAAEAPAGQHFDHWEFMLDDGTTTNVGTNTTYTGKMPGCIARLTAVYINCSVAYECIDEVIHYGYCPGCDTTYVIEEHTFSEATETEPATCRYCGFSLNLSNIITAKTGSNTSIDYDAKIIANILPGATSLDSYVTVSDGYRIEYSALGTAKEVKLYNSTTQNLVDTFTIVIYGDINGDGWYDGQDAVYVNLITNGMLSETALGTAKWKAADCNKDGIIDANDYQILVDAGVLLNSVDQTAELSTQSAYTEYVSLLNSELSTDTNQEPTPDKAYSFIEFIIKIFEWLLAWIRK